ncbi:MAG: hypothetical protein M1831_004023 [Alyxoria varia]|nr:MAG: hypothetical protein M1831_004023 [Alyxoria varia]
MPPTGTNWPSSPEKGLEYPSPLFLPVQSTRTGRSFLPEWHSNLVGAYIIGNHMNWNDFESVVARYTERIARLLPRSNDKAKLAAVSCHHGQRVAAPDKSDLIVDHFMSSLIEPAMDILHKVHTHRPLLLTGDAVVTSLASSIPGCTQHDILSNVLGARGIEYKEPDIVVCNRARTPRAVGMLKPCLGEDLELEKNAFLAGHIYGKFASLLAHVAIQMKLYQVQYGFMSNYRQTIILKSGLTNQGYEGGFLPQPHLVLHSNIISHSCDDIQPRSRESNGRSSEAQAKQTAITTMQAMLWLLLTAVANEPTTHNEGPSPANSVYSSNLSGSTIVEHHPPSTKGCHARSRSKASEDHPKRLPARVYKDFAPSDLPSDQHRQPSRPKTPSSNAYSRDNGINDKDQKPLQSHIAVPNPSPMFAYYSPRKPTSSTGAVLNFRDSEQNSKETARESDRTHGHCSAKREHSKRKSKRVTFDKDTKPGSNITAKPHERADDVNPSTRDASKQASELQCSNARAYVTWTAIPPWERQPAQTPLRWSKRQRE